MMTDPVLVLNRERHLAFVDEVSSAESFDELPDWIKGIVHAGERQMAETSSRRASVSGAPPVDPDAPQR
jgi:hypothetical protein